jgi:hypothetical protein
MQGANRGQRYHHHEVSLGLGQDRSAHGGIQCDCTDGGNSWLSRSNISVIWPHTGFGQTAIPKSIADEATAAAKLHQGAKDGGRPCQTTDIASECWVAQAVG